MIGDAPTYYKSLAKDSYQDHPKDYKRTRPIKDRVELLKTNYNLGEEPSHYQSAAMGHFAAPSETWTKS